jgi:SAM-dependent methyltransferase
MERWRARGQFADSPAPETPELPRTEILRLGSEILPQVLVNLRHGVQELPDGSVIEDGATYVQAVYEVAPGPEGIAYIAAALRAEAAAAERGIDTVAITLPPSLARGDLLKLGYSFMRTDRLYDDTPMSHRHSEHQSPLGANAERFMTGKVLDVGAGWGFVTQEMARHGAQVTAVEPDKGELARLRALQNLLSIPIEILDTRIEALQLVREYDAVLARHILHFIDPVRRMEVVRRLGGAVAPGGALYIEGWIGTLKDDRVQRYPLMRGELEQAFQGWNILEDTVYELPNKDGQLAQRFVVEKPQ